MWDAWEGNNANDFDARRPSPSPPTRALAIINSTSRSPHRTSASSVIVTSLCPSLSLALSFSLSLPLSLSISLVLTLFLSLPPPPLSLCVGVCYSRSERRGLHMTLFVTVSWLLWTCLFFGVARAVQESAMEHGVVPATWADIKGELSVLTTGIFFKVSFSHNAQSVSMRPNPCSCPTIETSVACDTKVSQCLFAESPRIDNHLRVTCDVIAESNRSASTSHSPEPNIPFQV